MRIFCAASLGPEVEQVCQEAGWEAIVHQGGSYTLARQLQQGAEADLFLSADTEAVRGLSKEAPLEVIASNRLVLVAPASVTPVPSGDLASLLKGARSSLALADPATAPLGRYTEQALEGLDFPQERKRLLKDAKAVLSAISLGHAELGVLYRSDATGQPNLTILAEFPTERHAPIQYVALILDSDNPQVHSLLESLKSGPGQQKLLERGFSTPD